MRLIPLAALALCTLFLGNAIAQENAAPKTPQAKIDYSILGQPAPAAKVGLSDEQRAAIATILDNRVNDLVTAEPQGREEIVDQIKCRDRSAAERRAKAAAGEVIGGRQTSVQFFQAKVECRAEMVC